MKNFYLILTLLIAALIFIFSSQSSEQSSFLSKSVSDVIGNSVPMAEQEDMSVDEQKTFSENIHIIVRKNAHFSLFLLLGISAGMWGGYFKLKRRFLIVFLSCALYGALDEIKQLFVVGRSFSLLDIVIDSSGALIGVGIAILIRRALSKQKAKNI